MLRAMNEDTRKPLIGLLLVLAATVLAYQGLAYCDYAWDDEAIVGDNAYTGDLVGNFTTFFQLDLWETTRLPAPPSGYYRPLLLVSLALDRSIFGLDPGMHHLVSLGWHCLAVVALFTLLRQLTPALPALAGTALFALHPVQSEAVALIAARNDLMAAAFGLFALALLVRDKPSVPALVGAGLCTLFGLLSKESVVLLPGLLLALDLARRGRIGAWQRYLPMALAFAVYAGMRVWADVGSAAVPEASSLGIVAPRAVRIAGTYAGLLIWPWPLTPARHVNYLAGSVSPVPALLMGGVLVATVVRAGRDRRLALAGLAWALLTFSPTLVATLDKGLLGERFLYLPLAGLAVIAAAALPKDQRLRWAVPVAALVPLVVLLMRIPDWRTSESLWRKAHEAAPSAFTHAGLGFYVNKLGHLEESRAHFIAAIATDPPYLDACPMITMVHLSLNRPQDAVVLGEWALNERGCPATPELIGPYAVALAGLGRWDQAVESARRMQYDPMGLQLLVLAADRVRVGDGQSYVALAAKWPGADPFEARVAKLLRLSGEPEKAARLLEATAAMPDGLLTTP